LACSSLCCRRKFLFTDITCCLRGWFCGFPIFTHWA
jgi:hypothetical protein